MLGGGDRIAEGRVHDDDSARAGRGHVDRVDADAGAADDLQAGQAGVHRGGVDLCRAADGDAVIAANDLVELLGREAGLFVRLDSAVPEDRRGLGVHLVGDEDFDLF
jgi:hypothetical protein